MSRLAKFFIFIRLAEGSRLVGGGDGIASGEGKSRALGGALAMIRQEVPTNQEDEEVDSITRYVSEQVLEQCQKLAKDDSASEGTKNTIKEQVKEELKLSKLCEQRPEEVPKTLYLSLNNTVIRNWLCSGFAFTAMVENAEECRQSGEVLLGGLQVLRGHSLKASLYLAKAAFILVPLPAPLGRMLDRFVDLFLMILAYEADDKLDMLTKQVKMMEPKMWDISQKVVAQEFLRVGEAQVKVAEEQVKDVRSLEEDDLWPGYFQDKRLLVNAKRSSRFNRWAAIEQSLAMTMTILKPPDFMETPEEMKPFIEVMQVHFEIQMAVLSRMFQIVEFARSFHTLVETRARRAALAVLPYFMLVGADSESLLETLRSPLLRRYRRLGGRSFQDPCGKEEGTQLLVCTWLELLSSTETEGKRAEGFEKPSAFCNVKWSNGKGRWTKVLYFKAPAEAEGTKVPFLQDRDTLFFRCQGDEESISTWSEVHEPKSSGIWKNDGQDGVFGTCAKRQTGIVQRHLKVTTIGNTFCTDMLTYGDMSFGELVSVNFDLDSTKKGCDQKHNYNFKMKVGKVSGRKIKNSTCYISNIWK